MKQIISYLSGNKNTRRQRKIMKYFTQISNKTRIKSLIVRHIVLMCLLKHFHLVGAENKNIVSVKKLHKTHTNENYARSVKNYNSYSLNPNADTETCKLNIECSSELKLCGNLTLRRGFLICLLKIVQLVL